MNEEFNKFSKKILIETIIKSLLIGFIFAGIILSSILITFKVIGNDFNIVYYILIFIGSLLLVSGLSFFFLKQNKIKIARRIDKNYNLKEKVQTMVRYENQSSPMIDIQREDVTNRLKEIPIKNFKFKFNIAYFILAGIVLITSVTAIVIPGEVNAEIAPEQDINEDNPELTVMLVEQIIAEIRSSGIKDANKEKFIAPLTQLVEQLNTTTSITRRRNYAYSCVTNLNQVMEDVNVNDDIYDVLKESQDTHIKNFATNIGACSQTDLRTTLDNLNGTFSVVPSAIPPILQAFQTNFVELLVNSELNKEEPLYLALMTMVDELETACATTSGQSRAIKAAFDNGYVNIGLELADQLNNTNIHLYAVNELVKIFNLTLSNNNDDDETETVDPDHKPTEDEVDGGGGTGETTFGGDAYFYDKDLGSVKYSEVINTYYQIIQDQYERGLISEELRNYYIKYFQSLYGSNQTTE